MFKPLIEFQKSHFPRQRFYFAFIFGTHFANSHGSFVAAVVLLGVVVLVVVVVVHF